MVGGVSFFENIKKRSKLNHDQAGDYGLMTAGGPSSS